MSKIFKIMILSTIVFLINTMDLENIRFISAGVIPRVQINNKYYLILGKETQGIKNGKFDCFCGSRENKETSWQTASREFYEESVGALGNLNDYRELKTNIQAKIVLFKGSKKRAVDYIINLTSQQYKTLVQNFYKNLKNPKLTIDFQEKSQLALFEEEKIEKMLKRKSKYHDFKLDSLIVDSQLKTHKSNEQIYSFLPEIMKRFYNHKLIYNS